MLSISPYSPAYHSPAKRASLSQVQFAGNSYQFSELKFYTKEIFDRNKDRFEKAVDGIIEELNKMGQGTFQKETNGPWELERDLRYIRIIKNNNTNDGWLKLSVDPEKEGIWKRTTFAGGVCAWSSQLGNPSLPQGVKDKVQALLDLLNPKTIRCFPDMEYLRMDFNPDIDTLD